ncbi:DUF945 family protein, partial [Escherichia coli]|nr:DUF945 family protein [Escherichia coli]
MIRKSATGVIVALAVIWGGGTWYTGTQIQPGIEKFIKDFNDAKKKGEHAYDMTLSYKNFDKGFFNSRFQMQMTFDNGAPDLNIKPGQKVVFDVDVGNDSNLLIVFYVQIMPDDFVMQLHR